MLDELAKNYQCSIVLCTATQPRLAEDHFLKKIEKAKNRKQTYIYPSLPLEGRELAPDVNQLSQILKRNKIELVGFKDDETLIKEMTEHHAPSQFQQGLIIVNTRKHALNLYRKLQIK